MPRTRGGWLARHEATLWLGLYLGALLALLLGLAMWGHDVRFHLVRTEEIHRAMREGNLHLVFSEVLAHGRPLPTYVYYSQWVYWPPSGLIFLGLSAFTALKCCYGALLVVLVVGCWKLFRARASAELALLATLLFATSNYVVGLVFTRAAYAELFASAFVPWALYFALRTRRPASHQSVALGSPARLVDAQRLHVRDVLDVPLALVLSAIILSHPLTLLNSAPLLAVCILLFSDTDTLAKRALGLVTTGALALLLTCFSWGPALLERRYVLGEAGLGKVPRFASWFPLLLSPSEFRTPGIATVLAFAVTAALLIFRRHAPIARMRALGLLSCVILYFVLLARISLPIWNATLLRSNIFAWRLLFPATLSVVLFVATVWAYAPSAWLHPFMRSALCLLFVANGLIGPSQVWYERRFKSEEQLEQSLDKWRTRLYGREKGFGVSEYLPNRKRVPFAPARCAEPLAVALESRAFEVPAAARDKCLALPLFWSPRYVATIGAVPARAYADRKTGSIVLLPNGHFGKGHILIEPPRYVRVFQALSLCCALLVLALGIRQRAWNKRHVGLGSRAPA